MPLFLSLELSKKWMEAELNEAQYREILDYEMSPDNMNYIPVWTIRSPKPRPDGKLKTEFWEWKDLPALGEKNPPVTWALHHYYNVLHNSHIRFFSYWPLTIKSRLRVWQGLAIFIWSYWFSLTTLASEQQHLHITILLSQRSAPLRLAGWRLYLFS